MNLFSRAALFTVLAAILSLNGGESVGKKTVVKTTFFDPNRNDSSYTLSLIDLMKQRKDLEIRGWGGIKLPSGSNQSSLMMSLAGGTSPDIGLSYFHTINNDMKQNFLYPLNEWIGEDKNGDGEITGDEVKWKEWNNFRPLWKRIAAKDGKIYGIPLPITSIHAIVFRTDLVKQAGLDPNKPPRTWDEFYEWCKRLTDPNRKIKGAVIQQGQRAIALATAGYFFLPWIQSAGGEPVVQVRKSPKNKKEYLFPMDAEKFITPEGEDLSLVKPEWRANWDTPEGRAALDFWYKLRWGKFKIDGTEVQGVARLSNSERGANQDQMLGRGEVAMMVVSIDDLATVAGSAGLDPTLLGWFPIPAGPGPKGRRVVQIFQHYAVMYANVKDRPKKERDGIWEAMKVICSKEIVRRSVENRVLTGMAAFISPEKLQQLGYEEYVRDVPMAIQESFREIENGTILSKTEPFAGHWLTIDTEMRLKVLGILMGANGEFFDYKQAFTNLQKSANSGLMFEMPEEFLAKRRPWAGLLTIFVICLIGVFVWKIIAGYRVKQKSGSKSVYSGWLPVLLLLPALLIIACWKYYPLFRGMVMAFQDYKVVGTSEFVGLDNFINLVYNRDFWVSIWRTIVFVFLNMAMVFVAPIILAILLTEVPRGKIFFRTLFFLPQMTSGIVIALLWKLMYDPTPAGFFNQILHFFGIAPQTWLDDPKMAMVCCIIPTVWAGMGMSSLIYLAALQSLPKELYEAADVDGATWYQKLFKITFPYLLPLIIINFVGSFIATFQGMGNIFLMTFGGPGDATMVIGMKIWQEAYVYLHFSMATSMAWIMGTGLIGLTYVQIQFLKRVEYKKASE